MEERMEDIEITVRSFYKIAINDIFLSYQFKKIIKKSNKFRKIDFDLGDFESHIPKVIDFWSVQLLPDYKSMLKRENVLKVHEYLNIKKGELGRWIFLFKKNLEEISMDKNLKLRWIEKLNQFEEVFQNHFFTYKI